MTRINVINLAFGLVLTLLWGDVSAARADFLFSGTTASHLAFGADVMLNPQPLPPFPSTKLNLDDPFRPVLSNPTHTTKWEINFGMNLIPSDPVVPPNPVKFSTAGAPNADGFYKFTGADSVGNMYEVNFMISGGSITPGSWGALNPQPLPPKEFPNEVMFSFSTTADLNLAFSVTANGAPIAFAAAPAAVPEPASLTVTVIGLLGISGYAWRRRRKTAGLIA
jgi:hypothetical protein